MVGSLTCTGCQNRFKSESDVFGNLIYCFSFVLLYYLITVYYRTSN